MAKTSDQIASEIRDFIGQMSRSNHYDNPRDAADSLANTDHASDAIIAAIDAMLADDQWSQDRQPYEWLGRVREEFSLFPATPANYA